MRVRVPDSPGALGKIAQALGNVDGDIRGVDIVGYDEDDSLTNEIVVVDDIVVDLPHGTLPDVLITAAQEVEGVFVDSIRPFSGSIDRRGHVRSEERRVGEEWRTGSAGTGVRTQKE